MRRVFWLLFAVWIAGCGGPTRTFDNEIVTVACGMCQFKLPDHRGCYWAAQVDGEPVVVQGPLPEDHNGHASDGMCVTSRRARVTGAMKGDRLVAESFDLLDFDAAADGHAAQPAHDHRH